MNASYFFTAFFGVMSPAPLSSETPAPESFNFEILWLALAFIVAALVLALIVWRSVAGWREKAADRRAEQALILKAAADPAPQTTAGKKAETPPEKPAEIKKEDHTL